MKNWKEIREIKTGYILSRKEIESLSQKEQENRKREMFISREEIRRLKRLEEELL